MAGISNNTITTRLSAQVMTLIREISVFTLNFISMMMIEPRYIPVPVKTKQTIFYKRR